MRWLAAIVLVVACRSDTEQAADRVVAAKIAKTELAAAERDFEAQREELIVSLRGELLVIGTQPMLIATFADHYPITDAGRADINDALSTLQRRLDEAANLVQALQTTPPETWASREAAIRAAMLRLEDARDRAWEALADAPQVDASFPAS